jgi:hypothetical protein
MIGWRTVRIGERKVRLFDCRGFSLGVSATSKHEETAKTFLLSRSSDGRNHIGDQPENMTSFESDYIFPNRGEVPEGPIFKALQMEDRYDIYQYNDVIFFIRSWGQKMAMRVEIERLDDGIRLASFQYDTLRYPNDDFALKTCEYLLKSHCIDMITPHPLHPKLDPKSEFALLSYSFSEFGRRAWQGSFENTLGIYNSQTYGFAERQSPSA